MVLRYMEALVWVSPAGQVLPATSDLVNLAASATFWESLFKFEMHATNETIFEYLVLVLK